MNAYVRHRVPLLVAGVIVALVLAGLAVWWHGEHKHLRDPATAMTAAEALRHPNARVRITDATIRCDHASPSNAPVVAPDLPADTLLLVAMIEKPCKADSFRDEGYIELTTGGRRLEILAKQGLSAAKVYELRDADDPRWATWLFGGFAVMALLFGSLGFFPYPESKPMTDNARARVMAMLAVKPLRFQPSYLRRLRGVAVLLGAFALLSVAGGLYLGGELPLDERSRWAGAQPLDSEVLLTWESQFLFVPSLLATANVAWRGGEDSYRVLWKHDVGLPVTARSDAGGVLTSAGVELLDQRLAALLVLVLGTLITAGFMLFELRKVVRRLRTLRVVADLGSARFLPLAETEIVAAYGIPTGDRVYHVRRDDGSLSKQTFKLPREPVLDGNTVLALCFEKEEPIVVCNDGYPFASY